MDDLGLSHVTERKAGIKTLLEAKTVNGRGAHIEIRPENGNMRVIARFGSFGDEGLSRAFLDRMAARHGTVETELPPEDQVDVAAALTKRPKASRTVEHPATMVDRQLDAGYRDSVVP